MFSINIKFALSGISVTYWPSTEPSVKRFTFVNKQENSETGDLVEDIGISP